MTGFLVLYFIYLWLCCVFVAAACGLSLVVESRGYSLAALHRLLIVVPSPVAEHRLCAQDSSVVVAHELSCSAACGIFPDQGSNPCLLHRQVHSYPMYHQASPTGFLYNLDIHCQPQQ